MGDEKDRDQRPWGGPGEPWISPGVEAVLPLSAVGDPHDHNRAMPIIPEHAPHTAYEREPRWHEIATEGLPPVGKDVLVYGWADNIGKPFMLVSQRTADGTFEDDEYRTTHGVTHWREMPAPPESANDGEIARTR